SPARPERSGSGATAESKGATPTDLAAVRRRATELQGEAEDALRRKDGPRALALVKEIAKLGEGGDAAAIELSRRIAGELNADHRIGVSRYDFDKAMRSDEMIGVVKRALLDPSADPSFRGRAVEYLADSSNPDTTAFISSLIEQERDPRTLSQMVRYVEEVGDPGSVDALSRALGGQQDRRLRGQIVDALGEMPGDAASVALQQVAASDPDEGLRRDAQLALTARNPPVQGYLLTRVVDQSQAAAAGLRPGDIMLSYDGVTLGPESSIRDLRDRVSKNATVPVTVWRDGQTIQVTLNPGQIGIDGKGVAPAR
ncbi:MAG TPA: HEAT repeat domain-containing protein, partial [Planctomycetota bacterium]|nr:HEAT repeat domain-containing protein [Planctomycetota bacterium]